MVEKRRKYTREFKLEAVRLADKSDVPGTEVARRLGIHHNLLYKWRKQFLEEGKEAFRGHGRLPQEDDRVRQLERELARAQEELEILKKAMAYFARESR